VALVRRRVDDGEWEAAVEVFEYMREFSGRGLHWFIFSST
jgi:pentatricopeptide repeat protein